MLCVSMCMCTYMYTCTWKVQRWHPVSSPSPLLTYGGSVFGFGDSLSMPPTHEGYKWGKTPASFNKDFRVIRLDSKHFNLWLISPVPVPFLKAIQFEVLFQFYAAWNKITVYYWKFIFYPDYESVVTGQTQIFFPHVKPDPKRLWYHFPLHLCAVSTVWSQSCKASCNFIFFSKAGRKLGKFTIIWLTVSRAPE